MAKASFNPADFSSGGGFGIEKGNVEITGIVSKVHQYPPNKTSGVQSDPFMCVQVVMRQLDEQFDPIPNTDEITMEYTCGKLEKFHPGKSSGPDDDDPEDLGTELNVEGNCIYAVEENFTIHKSSKWAKFSDALMQCGFKAEVLGNGYLPDLVGTKGLVDTDKLPKAPNSTSTRDNTVTVFKKITVFPYEKPKAKAAPVGSKLPAKANGKAEAPAAAPAESDDSIAATILTAAIANFAGQTVTRTAVTRFVQAYLLKKRIPVKSQKPIREMFAGEWLEEQASAEAFEGMFVVDGDSVTFAE